jgi:hypothetical protein
MVLATRPWFSLPAEAFEPFPLALLPTLRSAT